MQTKHRILRFIILALLVSQFAIVFRLVPSVKGADPSTVGTSTTNRAVGYAGQRKGFYAEGRFWLFYSDGTNAVFESTTDPTDWSGTPTSIGSCTNGAYFAIFFDGTYVHYAREYNYDLFYRRGTPNSNGTISWSAAEQAVLDGSSTNYYRFPYMTVDSNGYAWIGARYYNGTSYYPYVLKNANNNGTWSTDFSYKFSTTSQSGWRVNPVALTTGKIYVVCTADGLASIGRLYNGGWGSEETDVADYPTQYGHESCVVAYGDDVHFVYNRRTTYQIRYNKRTYGIGWGANDVLIADSTEPNTTPSISVDSNGHLYVFWQNEGVDHVYYIKCVSGTWDAEATDWINESVDDIGCGFVQNSFYCAYENYIGFSYMTKLASPYNVKFAYLSLEAPPPPTGGILVQVI